MNNETITTETPSNEPSKLAAATRKSLKAVINAAKTAGHATVVATSVTSHYTIDKILDGATLTKEVTQELLGEDARMDRATKIRKARQSRKQERLIAKAARDAEELAEMQARVNNMTKQVKPVTQ